MQAPGRKLRVLRERAGLSLSDVEQLTRELARLRRDDRFRVGRSSLSEIESSHRTPSIYRLYALASAYDSDIRKLLSFYGLS